MLTTFLVVGFELNVTGAVRGFREWRLRWPAISKRLDRWTALQEGGPTEQRRPVGYV